MQSTTGVRFVDTNILLYAVSRAAEEQPKCAVARALLDADDLALSVQVLQEFYVPATRSQETTLALMQAALKATARFRISYWDAAIIEAARALGCDEVLSEDLSPGQDYHGVKVVNPFRKAPRRRWPYHSSACAAPPRRQARP